MERAGLVENDGLNGSAVSNGSAVADPGWSASLRGVPNRMGNTAPSRPVSSSNGGDGGPDGGGGDAANVDSADQEMTESPRLSAVSRIWA